MSKLHELLEKEVSRKEFLRYVAIALLGMIGFTNMLKNLHTTLGDTSQSSPQVGKPDQAQGGYGMSSYGR